MNSLWKSARLHTSTVSSYQDHLPKNAPRTRQGKGHISEAQLHPLLLQHLKKRQLKLSDPRVEVRSTTEIVIH